MHLSSRELKRRLGLRLLLGGLFIAAILGGMTLWHEVEAVEESLVAQAVVQASALSQRLPARLDASTAPEIEAALKTFLSEHGRKGIDHFIGAEVYGPDRRPLAEAISPDGEEAESLIDKARHSFPADGASTYMPHRRHGRFYLQVMTGLPGGGYFEGIYHVTPSHLSEIRTAGLRAALLVILAVFATSALLYPLILRMNRDLLKSARALIEANIGAIEMLGNAIAKRDSDTNSHNYRVTLYALKLAEAAALPEAGIRILLKGAFLHDVGKLAIPDAILLKNGKLDEAEFAIMKTHVDHGLDIVERFQWLHDCAEVVGCHHEKYDGSGYGKGLAGEEIPLTARIFAIADVFDALTSKRPYKAPMPCEKALEIMAEGRGSHFDPGLLDLFTGMAPDLHAHYGNGQAGNLDEQLRQLGMRYFMDDAHA